MPISNFAKPKTSYKKLFCFQKAEAIYDLTYYFLKKHIPAKDRTNDQMLQAARSCKQNIVEGRADSAASVEFEIKLYGIARGSLHELLNDYKDYARTRSLDIWDASHERFASLRKTCVEHNDTTYFMTLAPKLNDEEFCNMIITLIHQTISMLNKMIDLVKEDFVKNGGIKEQMFRARMSYRKEQNNQK